LKERFTFGIPLIAKASAADWGLVDRLFRLTLKSVLAQTDQDFVVIMAGHDRPPAWDACIAKDPRFVFEQADWPAGVPSAANDDGGMKKHLIKQRVRASGGGLLTFLDGDDWVDRDLVRAARAQVTPDHLGGIVRHGYAFDFQSRLAVMFPIPGAFDGPFSQLCGSSTVARIDPGSADPARADPHTFLGSHHEWEERARQTGQTLALLDLLGAYVIGTNQSHSESQGPFATWRRTLADAVRAQGAPLDEHELGRFGLSEEDI
jgi:hypothetical protein